MPNITRGERLGGLMQYLVGPGRHNEHTEPHLVAGDDAIMAWHDVAELDGAAARDIAAQLDRPRQVFGTEIPDGHVWHCSLSLRASEGQLSGDVPRCCTVELSNVVPRHDRVITGDQVRLRVLVVPPWTHQVLHQSTQALTPGDVGHHGSFVSRTGPANARD